MAKRLARSRQAPIAAHEGGSTARPIGALERHAARLRARFGFAVEDVPFEADPTQALAAPMDWVLVSKVRAETRHGWAHCRLLMPATPSW